MKKKLLLIFFSIFFCASLHAQKLVKGKVLDALTSSPLPGVSVSIKGSNVGTVTNVNGEYSIQANSQSVLVFKFLGYSNQEVLLGNRETVNINLNEDNTQLSEVVVTALGIKREEKSIGYSAQQIKGDDLTLTKEQNVIGSLAGKIAGAQVTGASGASLGGTQKIKLRGVNSINGSGQPLMVVDGTPIAQSNFSGTENGLFLN